MFVEQSLKGYGCETPQYFRQNWNMNKRNRAQVRLMRDYEEIQNDPPYVDIESEL